MPPKKSYSCGICNKKCEKQPNDPGLESLECECCKVFYHRNCAEVDQELVNTINKYDGVLHWYCPHCSKGAAKLQEKCNALTASYEKLSQEVKTVKDEMKLLKEELQNERLQRKIALDKLEQYSRKDSLRVNGIPYNEGESNAELEDSVIKLADAIGVKMNRSDISVTHRLRPTKKGVHPVIIKFSTRRAKDAMYNAKKNLKDMDGMEETFISEDLTHLRFRTLLQCKRCPDFKSLTTRGGKIKVWKTTGGTQPTTVESPLDISKLGIQPDLSFLGLQED